MKKTIFISIFYLTITILNYCQEKGQNRISLVIEPVLSWIKSDEPGTESKGILPGYNFGIKIDHFFGDNYAFATGLTVNTAGGKISYPEMPIQTYLLKHIEIPLGLRLRSGDMYRINIYGRFGLSPQVNIKATNSHGNNIGNEIRLFDLGYHLGGGIEYSLGGRNALIFGLIFNNGFVDITKIKNLDDKAILNRLIVEFGFIF
jgi:hypothetical protein